MPEPFRINSLNAKKTGNSELKEGKVVRLFDKLDQQWPTSYRRRRRRYIRRLLDLVSKTTRRIWDIVQPTGWSAPPAM